MQVKQIVKKVYGVPPSAYAGKLEGGTLVLAVLNKRDWIGPQGKRVKKLSRELRHPVKIVEGVYVQEDDVGKYPVFSRCLKNQNGLSFPNGGYTAPWNLRRGY